MNQPEQTWLKRRPVGFWPPSTTQLNLEALADPAQERWWEPRSFSFRFIPTDEQWRQSDGFVVRSFVIIAALVFTLPLLAARYEPASYATTGLVVALVYFALRYLLVWNRPPERD